VRLAEGVAIEDATTLREDTAVVCLAHCRRCLRLVRGIGIGVCKSGAKTFICGVGAAGDAPSSDSWVSRGTGLLAATWGSIPVTW